jgi:hypothetical protein
VKSHFRRKRLHYFPFDPEIEDVTNNKSGMSEKTPATKRKLIFVYLCFSRRFPSET